jgi:hypothetical protein
MNVVKPISYFCGIIFKQDSPPPERKELIPDPW